MKPAGGVRREIRHNMPLYVGSLEGADRAEPLPRGWSLKVGRPLRGLSRQSEKCDVDDPLGRWSSAHQPRDLGQPRAADVTAASNDAGHMFLSVTAFRWARPISDAQSLTQPEGLVRIASRGPLVVLAALGQPDFVLRVVSFAAAAASARRGVRS